MKIKTLDELKKIREESFNKIKLRQHGGGEKEAIEVLVGMATCGISSGSRETLQAFIQGSAKHQLSNVRVIPVGCVGYCHSEPTVQVNVPGKEPVLYGNVKEQEVEQIIEKHIIGGNPVENLLIKMDFERA